jgi:pyruvate-formate lyase-activating enzyme
MPGAQQLANTRQRMAAIDTPNQVLGRTQSIGCVAVEITQKCNLDCTLCYLSENSQQVHDIPIEEVYRRLDGALEQFGAGTHVQITGGDPTLRKHSELVEIVGYARQLGLFPALFTNGIGATRALLERLAAAGLADVSFHVDTTQRREGYDSENELNDIRREYLERTAGLGLMVIFNTTVHRDNFDELPELTRFFRDHADQVGLVSFNLQAETGRGEWGSREIEVSKSTVRRQIEAAANRVLPWDVVRVGHIKCHDYLPTLVCNGRIHAAIDNPDTFARLLAAVPTLGSDRHLSKTALIRTYGAAFLTRPGTWWPALTYFSGMFKRMGADFVRSRGRVHQLTFFIQNFMDANDLDNERIDACSFMVMTADGPASMCEHNAKRDEYILKPLDVKSASGAVIHYVPLDEVKRRPKYAATLTASSPTLQSATESL